MEREKRGGGLSGSYGNATPQGRRSKNFCATREVSLMPSPRCAMFLVCLLLLARENNIFKKKVFLPRERVEWGKPVFIIYTTIFIFFFVREDFLGALIFSCVDSFRVRLSYSSSHWRCTRLDARIIIIIQSPIYLFFDNFFIRLHQFILSLRTNFFFNKYISRFCATSIRKDYGTHTLSRIRKKRAKSAVRWPLYTLVCWRWEDIYMYIIYTGPPRKLALFPLLTENCSPRAREQRERAAANNDRYFILSRSARLVSLLCVPFECTYSFWRDPCCCYSLENWKKSFFFCFFFLKEKMTHSCNYDMTAISLLHIYVITACTYIYIDFAPRANHLRERTGSDAPRPPPPRAPLSPRAQVRSRKLPSLLFLSADVVSQFYIGIYYIVK